MCSQHQTASFRHVARTLRLTVAAASALLFGFINKANNNMFDFSAHSPLFRGNTFTSDTLSCIWLISDAAQGVFVSARIIVAT